jgi:hypothetical protein
MRFMQDWEEMPNVLMYTRKEIMSVRQCTAAMLSILSIFAHTTRYVRVGCIVRS